MQNTVFYRQTQTGLAAMAQARLAGVFYLIIILCGLFAEGVVRASIFVPGNPALTAQNIVASGLVFRLGFLADLVMILSDVALAWILYLLLRPVSQSLALLAAFFRMAQSTTLAANLLNHFAAGLVLQGGGRLEGFAQTQAESLAYFFLEMHNFGYYAALVFFAAQCLVLGWLMYQSGWFPKILGALMMLAGVAYAAGSIIVFLFPFHEPAIASHPLYVGPAIVAELSMCLWLLFKGVPRDRPAGSWIAGTNKSPAVSGKGFQ